MRGHTELIALRKSGKHPKYVFLNDYPCKTDWFEFGDHVTIETSPSEAIGSLDLRFLRGVTVSVSALSEKRAKALFKACQEAGAKTVAACHVKQDKYPSQQDGWMEVWHG